MDRTFLFFFVRNPVKKNLLNYVITNVTESKKKKNSETAFIVLGRKQSYRYKVMITQNMNSGTVFFQHTHHSWIIVIEDVMSYLIFPSK